MAGSVIRSLPPTQILPAAPAASKRGPVAFIDQHVSRSHSRADTQDLVSAYFGEPPILPAPGSMAAHERLGSSLHHYVMRPSETNRSILYRHALNCGMPVDLADTAAVVAWAERRLSTYRDSLGAA